MTEKTNTDELAEMIASGIETGLDQLPITRTRWTKEEMMTLARQGVTKVDRLGKRGTTLCSMNEIEAMAATLALTGVLTPAPKPEASNETTMFKSRRTR